MAITNVATKVGQAYRMDNMDHGLRIGQFEFSESAYSAGAANGIDIQGNAAKFGFRKVFAILAASVRTSAGVDRLSPYTQGLNNTGGQGTSGQVKLHLYQAGTAGVEYTGAGAGATQLATTDIINVVLMGV